MFGAKWFNREKLLGINVLGYKIWPHESKRERKSHERIIYSKLCKCLILVEEYVGVEIDAMACVWDVLGDVQE